MKISKKVILFSIVAIAGVLFAINRWAPYPITNENPTGQTIIAFGNSITAGYGVPEDENYPSQLSDRLGVEILNKGVSGDTTADGLKRLDRDVLTHDPRIVLLCLGGNDILRKVPDEELIENLRTIIRRIQREGALVILITVEGSLLRPGLGGKYKRLAVETGCPLVPDVLGSIISKPDLMHDKIHPNAAGYDKMTDKIAPVLEKYL